MGSGGRGCRSVVRIRTNADATFQDPVSEQQRSVHSISSHYDATKVVILGIEYRYRSLSSIEVSSIDVIAGIVLTLECRSIEWQTSVSWVDGRYTAYPA